MSESERQSSRQEPTKPDMGKTNDTKGRSALEQLSGSASFTDDSELSAQLTDLKKKLDESKETIKNLTSQNRDLENDKKELDQKYSSLKIKLEKQLQYQKKLEDQIENQKDIIKSSGERMKKDAIRNENNLVETPNATFRIYLYKRQGHFDGKIMNVLSKEVAQFQDMDYAAIGQFISKHLPTVEDMNGIQSDYKITSDESKGIKAAVNLEKFSIPNNSPFKIGIWIDQSSILTEIKNPKYNIHIYAQNLSSGKNSVLIEKTNIIAKAQKEQSFDLWSAPLTSGSYRLECLIRAVTEEGKRTNYSAEINGPTILVS
jgi:hypothetical protein